MFVLEGTRTQSQSSKLFANYSNFSAPLFVVASNQLTILNFVHNLVSPCQVGAGLHANLLHYGMVIERSCWHCVNGFVLVAVS